MDKVKLINETYEKNGGIFKLIPVFVPRQFSTPAVACACIPMSITHAA